MKYFYLPLMIAAITLSAGCKKSSNHVLDGDFEPIGISVSDVRMFTSNGEVKDLARILNHINARGAQAFFTFQRQEDPRRNTVELRLHNGKAVLVSANSSETRELSYSKTGKGEYLLTWTSPVTVNVPAYSLENSCSKVQDNIYKYPIKKLELTPMPGASGMYWSYRPSTGHVLKDLAGIIEVPLLSFMISGSNPLQGCSSAVGDYWNELNEDVVSILGTGDTLLVQSKTMLMGRR